jgi:hypothetical protein
LQEKFQRFHEAKSYRLLAGQNKINSIDSNENIKKGLSSKSLPGTSSASGSFLKSKITATELHM